MSSCSKPIVYSHQEWATIVTEAEQECAHYVRKQTLLFEKAIGLDIGVGASFLFQQTGQILDKIDGITVIDKEVEVALAFKELFPGNPYSVYKINKFNLVELDNQLESGYDLIVDVNPKTYGCCQAHWEEYFQYILSKLNPGGTFLTHTSGFGLYMDCLCSSLSLEEIDRLIRQTGLCLKTKTVPSGLVSGHQLVIIQ